MTTEILRFIWAVLPSIFVGLVLGYYTKKQNEKERAVIERAEMRKKESLLTMKMTFANGKLAHATAVAYKHGHMNGELAEAEKAYREATTAYKEFLNSTFVELIEED